MSFIGTTLFNVHPDELGYLDESGYNNYSKHFYSKPFFCLGQTREPSLSGKKTSVYCLWFYLIIRCTTYSFFNTMQFNYNTNSLHKIWKRDSPLFLVLLGSHNHRFRCLKQQHNLWFAQQPGDVEMHPATANQTHSPTKTTRTNW